MKKRYSLLISVILLTFLLVIPINAMAATSSPLDEIENYEIQIDPRTDGTLDMKYVIDWTVLDSKSEGKLEWIKIGCPNSHVDEIVGLTDNIDEIREYEEGSNTYIRIDLDRPYEAGEKLHIEYTIHQAYMYIVEEENHLVRYSFTAGWFPDINVKNMKVLWNASNVIEATTNKHENGYYVWEGSLAMDQRFNVSVKYNSEVFDYDLEEQYVEGSDMSTGDKVLLGFFIVIAVIILIGFVIALISDDYDGGYSGGGRSSVFIHTHSSSCASSCACVSSCACACACAGGGRAGCTKKDFYQTNLKVEDLNEVLKE